ncbi:unnamed protein product [Anisakis simplex]|uniref:Uncharacterized protein n=1 Tax=Anisakis simplex TaxID=6269 RepID=A0A0M3K974_ANISI|nr:unnamed protein product [Anisakis simplex]
MVYVIDTQRGQQVSQYRPCGACITRGGGTMIQHNIRSDTMSTKTMRGGTGFGTRGSSGSVLIEYLVIKSCGGRGGTLNI